MLTPSATALPPGLLTAARRRTVRHELQEADKHLSLVLMDGAAINTHEDLAFAQAAVRDALRWLDEICDAVAVLVALDEIKIQDISNPAAIHLDFARAMLRRP
jgi:hypothetical protein